MPERLSFVPLYHAAAVEASLSSDEHVSRLLGRAASQHLEQERLVLWSPTLTLTLTPTLTLTLTLTLTPILALTLTLTLTLTPLLTLAPTRCGWCCGRTTLRRTCRRW